MIKVDAIILAHRTIQGSQTGAEYKYSAMRLISGKPVLEWTIDALCGSGCIKKITVIGPDKLDNLLCMRYVDRRIPPESISGELAFQQIFPLEKNQNSTPGYLIVPCEAVLLSSSTINQILFQFGHDTHNLFFPVTSSLYQNHFPHLNPEQVHLTNENIIPGYLALFRDAEYLSAAFSLLNKFHLHEKLFDNSGISTSILKSATNLNDLSIRYFESNDPSVVFAAFTDEDIEYARNSLQQPFSTPFSRVKVILNPGSGKSSGSQKVLNFFAGNWKYKHRKTSVNYAEHISNTLKQMGMEAEIIESTSSKHAEEIARGCGENGDDLVIAAGGDGTINSVVNGLAGSQTALGIIPIGTINLFALELDIPTDIDSACQIIGHARIKTIDLGKVNDRYFTSLCGIGFDADVISHTRSSMKKLLGAGAFILNGIKALFRYSFKSIQISIDQTNPKTGYIVIIGNGKYYGPSMLIAPEVSSHDGLLDIVIFKKKDALSLLRYVWELHKGDLTALSDVEHFRGKHISIGRQGRHKLHIDGEYYGRTPVEISVVSSALKVVC
ncbi:MAG TPA: YegS/Rv2252/BmrU family lipid kinase [Chitinispirillaceae bacterium]|nr:YegS/Rv2252/BmrU family lipid kinase [Chitinispirillaceae bacterium]